MKPALKTFVLPAALCAAWAGTASADQKTLPDFSLNSKKVAYVRQLAADRVPAVPPPTDTGYYDRYRIGAARVESSVTVVVREGTGRADIVFPKSAGPESEAGWRAALFIRLDGEAEPALSWATVFCSGGRYQGYKGASLGLPGAGGGDFSIKDETLALGPLKVRLLRTHPWVAAAGSLDGLCARDLPRRLKGYAVKALPASANGLAFSYDGKRDLLTVTWKAR